MTDRRAGVRAVGQIGPIVIADRQQTGTYDRDDGLDDYGTTGRLTPRPPRASGTGTRSSRPVANTLASSR